MKLTQRKYSKWRVSKRQLQALQSTTQDQVVFDMCQDLQDVRDTISEIIDNYMLVRKASVPLTWEERSELHHKLLDLVVGTSAE